MVVPDPLSVTPPVATEADEVYLGITKKEWEDVQSEGLRGSPVPEGGYQMFFSTENGHFQSGGGHLAGPGVVFGGGSTRLQNPLWWFLHRPAQRVCGYPRPFSQSG